MHDTLATILFAIGCAVAAGYLAWRFIVAFSKVGP